MNLLTFKRNRSSSTVKRAAEFLSVILVLLVVSLPLFSQGSQGTIRGAIFDQSGGAIAGAMVTVTDVARGVARTLVSDDTGQYVAASVNPGTYTVRVEVKGFKAAEHSGVLVEVGQDIRVDLTLQPGEQTQTVTVTGEVPAIETTSSTLGGTVSNQTILALPLNGRNFFRLLELRPGVVTVPGRSSGSSSSNGRRLGADVLLIEGLTQFDMATSNTLINGAGEGGGDSSSLLPIDAIQEFNTQQNAPAEYGWRDGSVINVGIKSGTNSLHGTAYAFGRDASATDAANFFTHTITPATLEQFGGTVGGRIVKDKVFWFTSFEGSRVTVASVNSITIPSSIGKTPADPDLSMVDACNAAKAGGGVNPLSAQLVGLNAATCVVSPASDTVENLFPYNATTSNLFYPGVPSSQPLNNGLVKGDWNLNDHNHLSGFYYVSKNVAIVGGSLQPYWNSQGINNMQTYGGGWTWTPNSTWVNDLRAGYAFARNVSTSGDSGRLPSDPYPTGYSMNTGVTDRASGGFPTISFNSIDPLGVNGSSRRGPNGQVGFKDTVSYLRGNHAFKFGFEHILVVFDDSQHDRTLGAIVFTNLTTFLQGMPESGSIQTGNPDERLRARWYAGFLQDTWRVNRRLTLTPGLRYEYDGPPHELNNYLGHFAPNFPGGVARVGPGLPYSTLYNAQKTNFSPRFGLAWDIRGNGKTVLRGGISLMSSVAGMTSTAQQAPFGASIPEAGIDLNGTDVNKHVPNNLSFGPELQAGWNQTGPIFPIRSAAGPSCTSAVPCATGGVDPNFKQPKSIQWNVDIQRAITSGLTLDVAYVGIHGYDEQYSRDLNAVPVGTGWDVATIAKCLASAPACKVNSKAIAVARPYKQFPWFNYIVQSTNGFHSNYNGLQVTVDQRAVHGVSFLAAYTFAHALDQWTKNSQGTQMVADPANPQLQYSNSDLDIRHRFRFSPTWAIPGKKSPGQMLEGWTVSGIWALQGGFPWGPIDATKNDWVGTGENRNTFVMSPNSGTVQSWNFIGPRNAFNSTNIPIPCYNGPNVKAGAGGCADTIGKNATAAAISGYATCQTAAQAPYAGNATLQALALQSLANNACYVQNGGILTPPAYGTNGDAGRNVFRGPSFKNVDVTVSKTWHLGERYSAQFRTEFFNVFNHGNFGSPATDPTRGLTGGFGYARATPDSNNPVFGSGGPRHIQFGLKLAF